MNNSEPQLPNVVRIGFSGSRFLFVPPKPEKKRSSEGEAEFQSRIAEWEQNHADDFANWMKNQQNWELRTVEFLETQLDQIRAKIGLDDATVFCGISAIAIGSDQYFAKALIQHRDSLHRIYLPQPLEEFFYATSYDGKQAIATSRDFSDEQVECTRKLLNSPTIVQEAVVGLSTERNQSSRYKRFEETNARILQDCDLAIGMRRTNTQGKPGGSSQFLKMANQMGMPTLEIVVSIENGEPNFSVVDDSQWLTNSDKRGAAQELANLTMPETLQPFNLESTGNSISECCDLINAIKEDSSSKAERERRRFAESVFWLILGSVLAAIIATYNAVAETTILGLLFLEAIILLLTLAWQFRSHSSKGVRSWANARLVSEIASSTRAFDHYHIELSHFFNLNIPSRFQRLIDTVNVLHLKSTKRNSLDWTDFREQYIKTRIDGPRGNRQPDPAAKVAKKWDIWFKVCLALSVLSFALAFNLSFKPFANNTTSAWAWSTGFSCAALSAILALVFKRRRDHFEIVNSNTEKQKAQSTCGGVITSPRARPQLSYYRGKAQQLAAKMRTYDRLFIGCMCLATIFAIVKLFCLTVEASGNTDSTFLAFERLLNAATIIMPVLAVAFLSWSGASDFQSKVETFGETADFLERQLKLIKAAPSKQVFDRLLIETETRLLGEVVSWYSRMANSGA